MDNLTALFSGALLEWSLGALLVAADIAAVAFIIKKLRSLENLLNQEIKRNSGRRKPARNSSHTQPLLSGSPQL